MDTGNVLELWRRLHEKWRLTASLSTTAVLVQLLTPAWETTTWDLDYEARTGDRISAGTRLAVAVRRGPAELAPELRREAGACCGDFNRFLAAFMMCVATATVYSGERFLDKGPGLPGRMSIDLDMHGKRGEEGGGKSSDPCVRQGRPPVL